jgi:hypothetical protein
MIERAVIVSIAPVLKLAIGELHLRVTSSYTFARRIDFITPRLTPQPWRTHSCGHKTSVAPPYEGYIVQVFHLNMKCHIFNVPSMDLHPGSSIARIAVDDRLSILREKSIEINHRLDPMFDTWKRFVNRSKGLPEAGKFPQVIFAAHFINTSLLI